MFFEFVNIIFLSFSSLIFAYILPELICMILALTDSRLYYIDKKEKIIPLMKKIKYNSYISNDEPSGFVWFGGFKIGYIKELIQDKNTSPTHSMWLICDEMFYNSLSEIESDEKEVGNKIKIYFRSGNVFRVKHIPTTISIKHKPNHEQNRIIDDIISGFEKKERISYISYIWGCVLVHQNFIFLDNL